MYDWLVDRFPCFVFRSRHKSGSHLLISSNKLGSYYGSVSDIGSDKKPLISEPFLQKPAGKRVKQVNAPSVVWTIFRCGWHLIIPSVIIKFAADVLQFANPKILKLVSGNYAKWC